MYHQHKAAIGTTYTAVMIMWNNFWNAIQQLFAMLII